MKPQLLPPGVLKYYLSALHMVSSTTCLNLTIDQLDLLRPSQIPESLTSSSLPKTASISVYLVISQVLLLSGTRRYGLPNAVVALCRCFSLAQIIGGAT